MEPAEVMDIGREAVFLLITIAAPAMIASLVVGLIIALFQALTQIQEMTLTFVPKIVAILLVLIAFMPFMAGRLMEFSHKLNDRIVHLE